MRPVLIRQPPVAAAAPILEVIARLRHVQADPSARTQVDRTALNAGPLCANLLFGQERQIASRSDLRDCQKKENALKINQPSSSSR